MRLTVHQGSRCLLWGGAHPAPRRAAAPRRGPAVVRADKDAELAAMQEFKAGLNKTLEAASTPAAVAEAEPAAAPAEGKVLVEVNQDNFYQTIEAAGSKLVVVDCFTDWCGPCKMILPTLQQWAVEMEDEVEIVKFNCNKHNKDLGIKLGIKVAPTFLLYKGGQQVAMMTGAKAEQLRELIVANK